MNPDQIFGQSNNTGTVSLEELENAFKTPTQRQADYEKPESTDGIPQNLINPDGEDIAPDVPEENEVSPEKAQRTGERIARMIDTGIDFALSNFVARNNETYRADERDLQDIAECWGEISQERGWNIGPEMSLVILYIMVYGPLVKQAFTDRRLAEIEARQQLQEDRLRIMEERLSQKESDGTEQPKPNQGVFGGGQPSQD